MSRRAKLLSVMITFIVTIAGLVFAFAVQASPLSTQAAVTHTVCAIGCDFSSIQTAIDTASPGDTLSLSAETYTEPFTVTKSLTIEGVDAESTILQAATAPGIATSRVLTVTENVTATISDVTVRYGNISGGYPEGIGGGILNHGTLTLDSSNVISNNATSGGGIYTHNAMTLTNSMVISNTADKGGGLYNNSGLDVFNAVNIANTTFQGNAAVAQYGAWGGAIYSNNYTNLDISGCTFENNTANYGGGAISLYRYANTDISDCTFRNNSADNKGGAVRIDYYSPTDIKNSIFEGNDSDAGGAIYAEDAIGIEILNSDFLSNTASSYGGAILAWEAELNIDDTYFANNNATDIGGALYINDTAIGRRYVEIKDSTFYSNTSYEAGALYVYNGGRAVIARSTFDTNHAGWYGGAILGYTGAQLDLYNSTLSNNTSEDWGGAIMIWNASTMTTTNVTMLNNSTVNNGGGIAVTGFSTFKPHGTIIAGSPSGGDCWLNPNPDYYGTGFDRGYNLIEDGSCISDATSFQDDPELGPLQDNGGKTATHALLENSPAINAIPGAACEVSEDQRGESRPNGAGCDIGAFELISTYEVRLPLVLKE